MEMTDTPTTYQLDEAILKATIADRLRNFGPGVVESVALSHGREIDPDGNMTFQTKLYETLLPVVTALFLAAGDLPLRDKPDVEPLTMEDLFGDANPTEISWRDVGEARIAISKRAEELGGSIGGVDDEEDNLLVFVHDLESVMGVGQTAVREGYTDDFLTNDLGNFTLPSWMEDAVDWEAVYERAVRYADEVENRVEGSTYYILNEG